MKVNIRSLESRKMFVRIDSLRQRYFNYGKVTLITFHVLIMVREWNKVVMGEH